MSETDLQRNIRNAVNALPGCLFWNQKIYMKRRKTGIPQGTPDLCGYVGAYFCGLEIKTEDGIKGRSGNPSTRANQLDWRTTAARDGAAVFVVSSVAEAIEAVQRLGAG